MLIDKSWKEVYVELQANPLESKTDKSFCEENNLNYGSFRDWKYRNRKQLYDEIERRRKTYIKEMRSVAYKHLMAKLGKDTNALKLFFQLSGDLVERTENRTEVMSPQDLKRGINEMLKDIAERKAAWRTEEVVEKGENATPKDVPVSTNQPEHEPGKDLPPTGTV
jgi:hypothetical protein